MAAAVLGVAESGKVALAVLPLLPLLPLLPRAAG